MLPRRIKQQDPFSLRQTMPLRLQFRVSLLISGWLLSLLGLPQSKIFACKHAPATSALRSQRQDACEFEANQTYISRPCLQKQNWWPSVVFHICYPSLREADAGALPGQINDPISNRTKDEGIHLSGTVCHMFSI